MAADDAADNTTGFPIRAGLLAVLLLAVMLRAGTPAEAAENRCVSCHVELPRFSVYHDPEQIGCSVCHLGNASVSDLEAAHAGMEPFPGRPTTVARTCGRSGCHADLVPLMQHSIMNSLNGMVGLTRRAFGEPPGEIGGSLAARLGRTGVDDYLRKFCVRCHLGNGRTAHGTDLTQRGGGCAACHLRTHDAEDARMRQGAPSRSAGPPLRRGVHPTLTLAVDDARCFGCHSRSGRIALNYAGLAEAEHVAPDNPDAYGRLDDGRLVRHMPPDLHAEAGMACIDCHTVSEVMGRGHEVRQQREQLDIQCADCHGAEPGLKLLQDLTVRELKIPGLYGWLTPDAKWGAVTVTARRGTPLWHLRRDKERQVLRRKVTGGDLPVPPAKPGPHHDLRGHERLTCQACHDTWAPQCDGCHIAYEADGRQWDHLERRETPGRWVESRWSVRAGPPALGVGADNRIAPFVPGMSLIAELPAVGRTGKPKKVTRTGYARIAPHTTSRRGRSCRSCHSRPEAMGVITGSVAHPARPDWRLPLGWVAADAPRPQPALHPGDRSFGPEERRRIARVGECLACHKEGEAFFRDFPAALKTIGDAAAHARRYPRPPAPTTIPDPPPRKARRP